MNERIGFGYDIHRLVRGRKLFLGGINIPYNKGLLGHSDADVLIHAICDALLGAMSKQDIGEHFPDTSSKYKGISSLELLKKVMNLMHKEKYAIVNLDTVVIAEKPSLSPFKVQIQKKLAGILSIDKEYISIKAKTNEGLGAIGNNNAIAAYAIALLSKGGAR